MKPSLVVKNAVNNTVKSPAEFPGVKRFGLALSGSGWRFCQLLGLPIPFSQSFLGLLTAKPILFGLLTAKPILFSLLTPTRSYSVC
jgi:hypothetical protein